MRFLATYMQVIKAYPLTDVNQKLASTVSYDYRSKDLVCVCLKKSGKLKLGVTDSQLRAVPYEQWVLFFETGGYPSVIENIVPKELGQVWEQLPSPFVQGIVPCQNNTANEDFIKQFR